MISRKLPNFLLKPILNFILYLYLMFSRLFHVDFEPSNNIDNSYTKFNSFNDPEPVEFDHQKLLAEAKDNVDPIKPVRRQKPLTVDVDECPRCGAPKEYLGSFGYDKDGCQKLQCKICDRQWAPEKPDRPRHTLLIAALTVVMPSVGKKNAKTLTNINAVMMTAQNGSKNISVTGLEPTILTQKNLRI